MKKFYSIYLKPFTPILIIAVSIFCLNIPAFSQQRIEVVNADVFEYRQRGNNEIRRLIGNVVFRQDDVIMSCDSAIQYVDRNALDAFGNIHINHGDTVHLYGNTLNYNGNTRNALIRGDVRMNDQQMTLNTPSLTYNMNTRVGAYTEGGTLISDENVLTSQRGYYHSNTKDVFFRQNVELVNPQYIMVSDTLRYNTSSRIAYFHGPTTITSDDNYIYCENGWYNTQTNISRFGKNAYLSSRGQLLYADSLYYDRNRGLGRARQNIRVIDTTEEITIRGIEADYYEHTRYTFITGNVHMIKPLETDTFNLTADTLSVSYDTSGVHRVLKGYYNARTYSDGFQSVSDSIVYILSDSIIRLFKNPIFWFDENQGVADSILIKMAGNHIDKVFLTDNAFMSSPEGDERFNQVKGRKMTGYFHEGEMERIVVEGNGESVYYIKDDDERYIGVNQIESSEITIYIADRKIKRIAFNRLPDGIMSPIGTPSAEDLVLPGFKWEGDLRPEPFNLWE